jgi:hypothetical protein
MDFEPKQAESKKIYESPRLATISLRPEEAVLGACKVVGSGSGQGLFGCSHIGGCPNQGS